MSLGRKTFLKSILLGGALFRTYLNSKATHSPLLDVNGSSDWDQIIALFNFKKDRIYMNNGTQGLTPEPVLKATKDALDNDSYGYYGSGEKDLLSNLGLFLKVDSKNLSLTHNTTEGINIAAQGLELTKGDEIIITDNEHAGAALPWLNKAKLEGLKIVPIKIGSNAKETIRNVKNACSKKTKVFALPHIPCTTGQVLPIEELCKIAIKKNIITVIDGAHGPGMLNLDLTKMGCDIYVSCGHKWTLAPLGTGFIYSKENIRKRMKTIFTGAHSVHDWVIEAPNNAQMGTPVINGHKFYYGTQSSSLYKGYNQALLFHMKIGQQKIENRIKELSLYLANKLLALSSDIKIITPLDDKERAGILSIVFINHKTKDIYNLMSKKKYRLRFVPESKLNCIRISTHIYNSKSDIDALVKEIKNILNAK